MYDIISKHPTTLEIYREKLIKMGIATEEDADKYEENARSILDQAFKEAPTYKPKDADWLESRWDGFKSPRI